MAVTDEQLWQLKDWADDLGYDGVLNDPSDREILGAVLDMAETHNMRTEDEFNTIIALEDIADDKDRQDIIDAYDNGVTRADEEQAKALGRRTEDGM